MTTDAPLPEGVLLSAGTVAEMVGLSRRTVTRHAKNGDLPFAWRAGTVYLFTPEAVADYLAKHKES